MTILALPLLTLSASPIGQSAGNSQSMNSPKSYRLLASGEGFAIANTLWYAVSVEAVPSSAAIKALVCEIVRHEKPVNYRVLNISIFVGLDSYARPVGRGDTEVDQRQNEHWIADYTWNVDIPERTYRLLLPRETRFEEFDHLTDCKE